MAGFCVTQTVVARIQEIAEKVASADGLEVVEVEVKGSGRNQMLRIYIDKPEGVTHADCEHVSSKVGESLDAEDLLPGHYTLEVSSPGVERKLKKWKDFERFQGQRVKVVLREPLTQSDANRGPKPGVKHFEGILKSAQDGTVTLELPGGEPVEFPFEQVDRANLKFDW
jgi:ribosome maturation factor RimP